MVRSKSGSCPQILDLTGTQVAVERIKEFSEVPREPPEFIEPRPPASWPEHGAIQCQNLSIRYAVSLGVAFRSSTAV